MLDITLEKSKYISFKFSDAEINCLTSLIYTINATEQRISELEKKIYDKKGRTDISELEKKLKKYKSVLVDYTSTHNLLVSILIEARSNPFTRTDGEVEREIKGVNYDSDISDEDKRELKAAFNKDKSNISAGVVYGSEVSLLEKSLEKLDNLLKSENIRSKIKQEIIFIRKIVMGIKKSHSAPDSGKYYEKSSELEEERLKILEEYAKLVNEGKVKVEKPTFLVKVGFKPSKITIQRKALEIISKNANLIAQISLALAKCEENSNRYPKTLEVLKAVYAKLSKERDAAESTLFETDFFEIEQAVMSEYKRETEESTKKSREQEYLALASEHAYIMATDPENIEKLAETEKKMQTFYDIDNQIKIGLLIEGQEAALNKQVRESALKKAYQEEREKQHEMDKELYTALRNSAIKELELTNKLNPSYEVRNGDVRDEMTAEKREQMIRDKMNEIIGRSERDRAIQGLINDGIFSVNKDLENLSTLDKESIEASLRIESEMNKKIAQHQAELEAFEKAKKIYQAKLGNELNQQLAEKTSERYDGISAKL